VLPNEDLCDVYSLPVRWSNLGRPVARTEGWRWVTDVSEALCSMWQVIHAAYQEIPCCCETKQFVNFTRRNLLSVSTLAKDVFVFFSRLRPGISGLISRCVIVSFFYIRYKPSDRFFHLFHFSVTLTLRGSISVTSQHTTCCAIWQSVTLLAAYLARFSLFFWAQQPCQSRYRLQLRPVGLLTGSLPR
jgi:hypothetical protein